MPDPQPINVLYLTLELLRLGQAANTHVRQIIAGLEKTGLEVTLVGQVESSGAAPGKLARLWCYFRLTLLGLERVSRCDVVYLRAHPALLVFCLVARIMGKPIVHEINGRTDDISVTYRLGSGLTRLLGLFQYQQYRRAAGLVAVTPGLQSWLRTIVDDRVEIFVVPNGVDTAIFKPGATGGPHIAAPFVLFFGGLVAWHGVDTMLAAVDDIAWPKEVRLVLVGTGQMEQKVRAGTAKHPNIVALGFLEQQMLAGLCARSLASLCCIEGYGARNEGGVAPLKLFEGMASGRPVIASDLPYQRDIVSSEKCGLIVAPGDAPALARAVRYLAEHEAEADAMGRRGRIACTGKFDWQFRAEDTAAILRDLVAGARRAGT